MKSASPELLGPPQRAANAGQDLERNARELEVIAALQTGNAEVVQRAQPPDSASSPKPLRSVAIAFVLGLLVAVGLTLLREQLDRRLRDAGQDVVELLEVPVLSVIAEERGASRQDVTTEHFRPGGWRPRHSAHAAHQIRTTPTWTRSSTRSLVISARTRGEQETNVARNLAGAKRRPGKHRVLCVEADMRRPTLATRLDVAADGGLSLILAGVMDAEDVVTTVNGVDVITAGPLPPNPAELIESQRMRKLIQWGEKHYDRVIIDTPPAAVVADAIPLVPMVSGVVILVRLGHSHRDAVERLRTQLANVNAPVLGVVLNGSVGRRSEYEYGRHDVFLAEAPEEGREPGRDDDGREPPKRAAKRTSRWIRNWLRLLASSHATRQGGGGHSSPGAVRGP